MSPAAVKSPVHEILSLPQRDVCVTGALKPLSDSAPNTPARDGSPNWLLAVKYDFRPTTYWSVAIETIRNQNRQTVRHRVGNELGRWSGQAGLVLNFVHTHTLARWRAGYTVDASIFRWSNLFWLAANGVIKLRETHTKHSRQATTHMRSRLGLVTPVTHVTYIYI